MVTMKNLISDNEVINKFARPLQGFKLHNKEAENYKT